MKYAVNLVAALFAATAFLAVIGLIVWQATPGVPVEQQSSTLDACFLLACVGFFGGLGIRIVGSRG